MAHAGTVSRTYFLGEWLLSACSWSSSRVNPLIQAEATVPGPHHPPALSVCNLSVNVVMFVTVYKCVICDGVHNTSFCMTTHYEDCIKASYAEIKPSHIQ